jgi:hypothetical protein
VGITEQLKQMKRLKQFKQLFPFNPNPSLPAGLLGGKLWCFSSIKIIKDLSFAITLDHFRHFETLNFLILYRHPFYLEFLSAFTLTIERSA